MKDLLNGFGGRGCSEDSAEEEEEEDSGEIELSLGLSLGGCFGVDPKRKGLARSSSVASMPVRGGGGGEEEAEVGVERGPLVRTCSLPVETEEEQRKRKSMQTMRRMEAKRRTMEKRVGRWSSWGGKGKEEEEEGWSGEKCGVLEGKVEVGSGGVALEDSGAGAAVVRAILQQSIGSQGSCSTDAGSLDGGGVVQGSKGTAEPSIMQTGPSWAVNRAIPPVPVAANGMSKNLEERNNCLMEQMPCVLARGEGPNGRVVEGFLYKYKKGEDVKIVCVCHGRFLTPAEFVKHAGGGDVAYPLRHIVVKPSPTPFL